MKISLIGYMGSGKSTVGKLLATKLGYSFKDLDTEIEKLEQISIQELFEKKGELYFRKQEKKILKNLLNSTDNIILSTGGGTVAFYDNLDTINENSISFYLSLSPTALSERLKQGKKSRPLIKHLKDENLTEFIAKHLFERNIFYQKAHYSITCNQLNEQEIVKSIVTKIKNHQNHS